MSDLARGAPWGRPRTPLPMTGVTFSYMTPDGMRCSARWCLGVMTGVAGVVATLEAHDDSRSRLESRSVILPLPSSPHCVPTSTVPGMALFSDQAGTPSCRADNRYPVSIPVPDARRVREEPGAHGSHRRLGKAGGAAGLEGRSTHATPCMLGPKMSEPPSRYRRSRGTRGGTGRAGCAAAVSPPGVASARSYSVNASTTSRAT